MRVAYLWLDYLLGWPFRVLPYRVRSGLVVLERGWLDLTVDPRRYRLKGASHLVRTLGRLIPRPDLTLVLDAPADLITARKSELDAFEAQRQRTAWRVLAEKTGPEMELIDAASAPESVVEESLRLIDARLAARHADFRAAAIALECIGSPSPRGDRFTVIEFGGRPRWIVPPSVGRGPFRLGLYRPALRRHVIAGLVLDASHSLGRGTCLRLDPEGGIAPAIADAVGTRPLRIAGAALSRDGGSRVVLKLTRNGTTVAFAKVDAEADALENEQRVLGAFSQLQPGSFVVPRVLARLEWNGLTVVVLEPLPVRTRSDRPFGELESAALEGLAALRGDLAEVLGLSADQVPVHGDFAPWNSSRTGVDSLAVWDWEHAHGGGPLDDYFHWHLQRIVLLSSETIDGFVARTLRPDRSAQVLCERLSVPSDEVPLLLLSYLERSSRGHPPASEAARVRRCAIDLLDRAKA